MYRGTFCDRSKSLSHHGILGQKWGIRRYQNEDGSLTAAGKRRYNWNQAAVNREISYQKNKIDQYRKAAKANEDSVNELRKTGVKTAMSNGADKDTSTRATAMLMSKRQSDADWYNHNANKLEEYNEKLSKLDLNNSHAYVMTYIQALGNTHVKDVNDTWVETNTEEHINQYIKELS